MGRPSAIARTYQRATPIHWKPAPRPLLSSQEFGRAMVVLDGRVEAAGLQVLADGHDVDVMGAQVVHHLEDLVPLLAKADHDARRVVPHRPCAWRAGTTPCCADIFRLRGAPMR